MLAKAFPDSPAIMDVNKEGWHVRDELDRDIVPEDSEVSESILWFIHAVGAEPDPASRSTVWLYTQGLHRCGWPELEMLDVPHQHAGSAMALLNGVGELLIEDGTPPPGEPFEVGPDLAITLQPWNEVAAFAEQGKPGHVEHRENHNNEKLIGVRAAVCGVEPVGTYRKVWTWPADVVKKLQQQGNTAIYKTRRATHRQERLARTTWNELAAAFASLKPAARSADENSQAIFLVQAGFQKPGSAGREHLWFAVQRIQGRRAQGRLVHPPRDIAHLREGEVIKIDPGMVSDWQVLTRQGVFGPDNVGGMKQAIQRIHEATA